MENNQHDLKREDGRMAIYREDIIAVELESGNIYRSFLSHTIGYGDDDANRFGIRAYRNGEPETLGGTCAGYFIRADGATIVIADGVVSGNLAYVTLPEACYAVEGQFSLAIKCQGGGVTGTLRIVDGVVSRTSTNAVVDPGTLIDSVEDLIDAIEDAVALIPSDVSEIRTFEDFSTSLMEKGSLDQYGKPDTYNEASRARIKKSICMHGLSIYAIDPENNAGRRFSVTIFNDDTHEWIVNCIPDHADNYNGCDCGKLCNRKLHCVLDVIYEEHADEGVSHVAASCTNAVAPFSSVI